MEILYVFYLHVGSDVVHAVRDAQWSRTHTWSLRRGIFDTRTHIHKHAHVCGRYICCAAETSVINSVRPAEFSLRSQYSFKDLQHEPTHITPTTP